VLALVAGGHLVAGQAVLIVDDKRRCPHRYGIASIAADG
jgi:hypothetical protein